MESILWLMYFVNAACMYLDEDKSIGMTQAKEPAYANVRWDSNLQTRNNTVLLIAIKRKQETTGGALKNFTSILPGLLGA